MRAAQVFIFVVLSLLATNDFVVRGDYMDDSCLPGRTVIVHLFSWKWTDIAAECERYLGPNAYCGVQVSPPNEHRDIITQDAQRPWWERYQPISYRLESRSGTEAEFIDMVNRCNAVGVRIYVDAVINHMCYADAGTGIGSGGSSYDSIAMDFPAVPYTVDDFNCCSCGMCTTGDCNIQDYNNPDQVRNCRLGTLLDLALGIDSVRQKIANYMNTLIDIGVGGFRVDAMKHMWPGDVEQIWPMLNDLNTDHFAPGTRPFMYCEVIDLGGEGISSSEYFALGKITEFRYSSEMGRAFRQYYALSNLLTCCESWGMIPSEQAVVFIDNHDNQRGHGAGGEQILTFWEPKRYKMATAFTLAFNYGFTRIMSSYYWQGGRWQGDWIGPPHDANYDVKDVVITSDQMCGNDWICEHRWPQINGMVQFRNRANGQPMANQWDNNGGSQIAFSRGNQGFIAINGELSLDMDVTLQTGLSSGIYCDVISGTVSMGECTGREVYVDVDGTAQITIEASDSTGVIAIHAGSKRSDELVTPTPPPVTTTTTMSPPVGLTRTVILINIQTEVGQDAFIAGGIGHDQRPGCTSDAETSQCAISIVSQSLGTGSHYEKQNAWRVGNTKLNWYGPQVNQGRYYGMPAQGVPLVWTTNDPSHPGYQPINDLGPNYWLMDVYMDCTETENEWFEIKAFITSDRNGDGWEGDITQDASCIGTAGGSRPYSSINHMGRCGHVNIFTQNSGSCTINSF